MCGIIGYIGERDAQPILLSGLKALEYRGYDSAGCFITGYGTKKAVGRVTELEVLLQISPASGNSGIAHTRWATHGEPSVRNAHPHTDASGIIHIVHNGIIENYRQIKEGLRAQGISCQSDTDTEVLAKLIGSLYGGNITEAVARALSIVEGAYGIAVMSEKEPHCIVVARQGSPIIIGVGDGEHFVASDSSALLPYTKKVIYLDDGEMATLTAESYTVTSLVGVAKKKRLETIEWDIAQVQKNGFEHFMLKEINEIPEVIESTIRGRVIADSAQVKLGGLESYTSRIGQAKHLTIVGCGSAYYAGLIGRNMIEEYANLSVDVVLGSEYRYRPALFHSAHDIALAVTQSGETADTLASIRQAKKQGLLTLGMVNVVGSTIARETDAGIYNHAGPEIAVASTKAFISQITAFILFTVFLRQQRSLDKTVSKNILTELIALPNIVRNMLVDTSHIKDVAKKAVEWSSVVLIGRGTSTPVAYEGALKLKECTYIHAEAYPAGELKHGPIALLDESFPVIAIVPNDKERDKILSNIEEVKARKALVIVIGLERDTDAAAIADYFIPVPSVHPMIQPLLMTIPLQLLSYYIGVTKGFDVDKPRNLAKSVTVE
jgi:glucosamine--fructose-6-phosphate aminotransferase (isomerizing)